MIGKLLSHYRILEELGRGGMGIVYRAEDTSLDRTVAIKVLPSSALSSEDDRARFYREAKAAAQLHHPHIASIFQIDEAVPDNLESDERRPFIAMEYVEGETLSDRILQGPLKLEDAIRIASQIASGLEAAHEKDIVHRDIKSGNVMLTARGDAKILDFGLAQTAASTKLTRLGSTLGTVAYMSPEQARGEDVDRRTDIWALGVVLFEMITGQSPFPGDYEQAVVYEILNSDPEPVTALRTGVPLELERIVDKCLQKDRNRRYQHADDLIADLGGVEPAARRTTTRTTAISPASQGARRPAWLYAAAFLAGCIVAYLGFSAWGIGSADATVAAVSNLRRLTIESGREYHPRIHPDGNLVVYASGDSYFETKLYVRSISGSSATPLTNSFTGAESQPAFSPDGNSVIFLSSSGMFEVDFPAGVPTPLLRRGAGETRINSVAVSPDGESIAFTTNADSIFIMDRNSRERNFLASLRESHSLAWSRDGRRLAVVSGNADQGGMNVAPSSLYIIRLSEGIPRLVSDTDAWNLSPIWARDDSGILFVSDRGGARDIYFQRITDSDTAQGLPQRITTGLSLLNMDLSSDGSVLVSSELYYSQNIWASEIADGHVASTRNAVPVTTGDQIIEGVVLSHDGQWIAYDSNARGNQDIYVMPAAGGEPRQITDHPAPDFVYSWSPDDRKLAFHTFREGSRDVYTISEDDFLAKPVATSPAHERYPTWSGDGSRIGFNFTGEGSYSFVVSSMNDDGSWSSPTTVVDTRSGSARFSPLDDRILFYTGTELRIRYPDDGETVPIVSIDDIPDGCSLSDSQANWSSDAQNVYFRLSSTECTQDIWSVPAAGGTPKLVLARDGREWGFAHFSVGNGKIYYTLKEVHSDLWVMDLSDDR